MQTFLPVASFIESAKILDYRRLGKQRVEAKQILKAIHVGGGWQNHPAVRMWRAFEPALCGYYNAMVTEWIERGYNNNMPLIAIETWDLPTWFGNPAFHAAHRSNLLRKAPEYYQQFDWTEPNDLEYVWPV